MTPVDVVGLRIEVPANVPMVLLQEREGARRLLPIMIGGAEASAIHYALAGEVPKRPLTHDLFVTVIEALGAKLDHIVVTEVRDHTFYAELHLQTAGGAQVVSSRPSDAIALAVRCGSPIFAAEDLLDEVGQVAAVEAEEEEAEIIDEFVDFLENVNPDDFAS